MPDRDEVIVTCALTGVLATREQCPWVPYTAAEIAEEARRAYEAGAAVVHIHARTETGAATYEPAVYAEIRREIEARCPVILNFSTGGLGPMEGRVAHIREVKPALAALNMGSMNYAKYSARRREFVFDFVFENTFKDISYLLRVMREAGVKPELECFDVGHTNSVWPLLDQGLLHAPLQFSFIMGVLGGLRASAENLAVQAREAPPGSTWEVIGISHDQWRMVGAALSLGGNVRVGLEDNFYLDAQGTKMASSNGELVEKAVRMSRDVGRRPATVEQARAMLSLEHPW
jgi:3-keto-5-aminohexanoate cleavage enzyme